MKATPKPDQTSPQKMPSSRPIILQMAVLIACRLLLNTGRRFIYPFAPAFSRALGVPLTAITSMIALNWATALLGVASGPLADRWGYRGMMIAGLLFLTTGLLAGGSIALYIAVLIGLALAGLGKSVFDPAVQAYVSERVPFQRRGLAIGFLEVTDTFLKPLGGRFVLFGHPTPVLGSKLICIRSEHTLTYAADGGNRKGNLTRVKP